MSSRKNDMSVSLQENVTIAHEIGHACQCMDIECVLPNVVSESLLGPKNWSGDTSKGYYREGLTQADAVCRFLMYAYDMETACDVPVDNVYGTVTEFGQTFESSKQCGLLFMDRNPQH